MDQVLSPTIAGAVSLFLPIFIDFVNTKIKESKVRYWVAIGTSFAIGGVSTLLTGGFAPETLLASVGTSFVVSQSVYMQYWKNSIKRIQMKTSLKDKM